ncbi:TonB-dependent receptor [Shewanella sedimentimangrovi]|uniref:TonB-dependent receptor n=1 Tax=Shewanella sedimentimangrovi TaxID=2814293 RepID=A0ABX7QZV7_9GAMM|nr:TonB-dependent receptor [Shewanella sedimentimangrovi]QSX36375.1 TonB-dependent receptor [Shewanella sedimentimangrovi]
MGSHPTSLALLTGMLLGTFAVQAAEGNSNTTDTLVVIGRSADTPLNLAANVNVIDAAAIAMSGATSLGELLRGQSGIQLSDNGAGPVLAMRGFAAGQAASNTLILVDGRRLNNIDIAAPDLNAIALNQVERIEILSGSAGVLYGDQAVGGVINIVTKAPDAGSGSLQLLAGNYATYEARGDYAGAINDNWRYYLTANRRDSDNYRDHSESETSALLARVQYEQGERSLFIEAGFNDDERELAGALTDEQFRDNPRQAAYDGITDNNHSISRNARLGYQQALSSHWRLLLDADYSGTDVDSISFGSKGNTQRRLLSLSPKFSGRYDIQAGELKLIAGADLSRGESKFDYSYMDRSNTQKLAAAFVQASVPLSSSLSYVIGGRYAEVRDELRDDLTYPAGVNLDNDAHALELGLNYRPNQQQRFYLRAEDNFRFAKVDEQAYTSEGVLGLDPQTGRSYEAGWDYHSKGYSLRLSAFRLDLEDEIVWDPSAPKPDPSAYFNGANVNADSSRRYGVALDLDWQPLDALALGLDYQFTDAFFTAGSNDGKALSWVARHSGRGFASYDLDDNWQLYLDAQYTGKRYIEGDNANLADKLDAYTLVNLALNYRRGQWLASVRADNLLDEDYVSAGYYSDWGNGYYPGSGRMVSASIKYHF